MTINLHEPLNIMLKFSHFFFFFVILTTTVFSSLPLPPPRHWLKIFLLQSLLEATDLSSFPTETHIIPPPSPFPQLTPGVKYLLVTVEIQQTNNSLLGPWPGSTVTGVQLVKRSAIIAAERKSEGGLVRVGFARLRPNPPPLFHSAAAISMFTFVLRFTK